MRGSALKLNLRNVPVKIALELLAKTESEYFEPKKVVHRPHRKKS